MPQPKINAAAATVLVALITSMGGFATAVVSLKTSSGNQVVVGASHDALAEQVNKLSEEVEKLHDYVYGINHQAGSEQESEEEDLSACPPYDLGPEGVEQEPLDAGMMSVEPTPPPAPAPPEPPVVLPAPPQNVAPLRLKRVPMFQQMMEQQGF